MVSPGCMRGSAITFLDPSSRTARDGQMIHENTTVSSSSRLTAMGNEGDLAFRDIIAPTLDHFQRAVFLEYGRRLLGQFDVSFAFGRGHRDHETIDVGHDSLLGVLRATSTFSAAFFGTVRCLSGSELSSYQAVNEWLLRRGQRKSRAFRP